MSPSLKAAFDIRNDIGMYKNNAMSDQEPENLILDEDQIKEIMIGSQIHHSQPKNRTKQWVIYCKKRGKMSLQQQYSKGLESVGEFNTIPDFFKFYTAIKNPSQLEIDTKIMYFLKGCEPFWEDWLHSGCLLFHVKLKDEKKDEMGCKILNSIWEYLLLSLIGNSLPSARLSGYNRKHDANGKEDIIGIILNRRQKISLIELWYRSDHNAAQLSRLIQKDLERQLQHLGKLNKKLQIRYKRHRDSFSTNSTMKGSYLLKGALSESF